MVRLALVGCGSMGHWHAQQLQKVPDLRVTALCDSLRSRTSEFRDIFFNAAHEFANYEELLAKAEIDAVLLVTPHALHYPQCKGALERDLHVLCEKPLVTSSDHAYELWRLSKQHNRLLGVAFQSSYTPEFQWIAQMRDAGRLGRTQNICGFASQNWYRAAMGKWRQDPLVSGGGFIYDTGAHMLNAMMWLMDDAVVEVNCYIENLDAPVDVRGSASLRFESGAFGSAAMAGNTPVFRSEIQLFTDEFLIITDQYGSRLEVHSGSGRRFYPSVENLDHPAAGTPHLNFANAILGREPLRAPARCGVLLSALMDAMYDSATTHATIKVIPVPRDIEVS